MGVCALLAYASACRGSRLSIHGLRLVLCIWMQARGSRACHPVSSLFDEPEKAFDAVSLLAHGSMVFCGSSSVWPVSRWAAPRCRSWLWCCICP